ncbi:MAG: hypothetical protein GX535_15585 [Xanthomonadaceae bacterium]|nr:hypothetical protein [Xanthomonadaceae bacterium]
MRHAIKCMCSHCQRETYFDTTVALETISNSTCAQCGNTGAVITLNIEAPRDAVIQDRVPRAAHAARESELSRGHRRCAN